MFSLPFVLSNLDVQGCIGAKHISFQLGAMVHLQDTPAYSTQRLSSQRSSVYLQHVVYNNFSHTSTTHMLRQSIYILSQRAGFFASSARQGAKAFSGVTYELHAALQVKDGPGDHTMDPLALAGYEHCGVCAKRSQHTGNISSFELEGSSSADNISR